MGETGNDAVTPKTILCIGAGYVGGTTMAVMADRCPELAVTVLDIDAARIAAWNSDRLPVFEPGLDAVVRRARGRNLTFMTQDEGASLIARADLVLIAVQTPTKTDGEGAGRAPDLDHVEACTRLIAAHALGHTIVVEKSTVPVRAAETIKALLAASRNHATFDVLSNPEFLAEGTAVRDLEEPDRVLIGGDSPEAIDALVSIYARWVPRNRIITTGLWSAELSKLTANAFLAQRISSINAVSALCEATEADVGEVAKAVGADSRIGPRFLEASIGFGGSCFEKDLLSLVYLCERHGLPEPAHYWQQVLEVNRWQKRRFTEAVLRSLGQGRVAVLGLAFKKNTNDFRESAAIDVCSALLRAGAEVAVYDPRVDFDRFLSELGHPRGLVRADSPQAAMHGAGAVAVLTEWDEFKSIDWGAAARSMVSGAIVFDGRRIVDADAVGAAGLSLRNIGGQERL